MGKMRQALPFLILLLASCGDNRPPAPTAEQNDQLNEAEAMLNNMDASEPVTPAPAGDRR